MKVKHATPPTRKFVSTYPGKVFVSDGDTWMKLDGIAGYNAVRLLDGTLDMFEEGALVAEYPDAELFLGEPG